jgi:hypothetical protein
MIEKSFKNYGIPNNMTFSWDKFSNNDLDHIQEQCRQYH